MEKRRLTVCVLAALAVTAVTVNLSACGGGGGNGVVRSTAVTPPVSPPPPPPPPPPPAYDSAFNHLIPTGAQTAQQAGFTGQGVGVGILDSGVDPTAAPMNGRITWFKSYLPNGSQSPNDTSGHGTVVADILGGSAAGTVTDTLTGGTEPFPGGVAPGAKLYFEQVCTSAGAGSCLISNTNYSDFVAQGVRIINQSFGSGDAQTEFTGPTDPNIAAVQAVFQPAVNAGILQVWAAGSNGAAQPWNQAGLPYWIPSFQPDWLAVVGVAIDSNGQPDGLYAGANAPSNACGVAMEWCLSAPASVEFPSVAGQFSSGTAYGTSASAAIVSGVAAQVAQAFPWMTAANLTDTILTTATPLDDGSGKTPNPTFGWGMVNAAKAVDGPAQFAFGTFNAALAAGTTSTFTNDIGGSGGLTLSGPGTLVLAGNNTYSGGTIINAGTLQSAAALPGNVTVNAGGTLDGAPGTTGNLSNSGRVAIHGDNGGAATVKGSFSQTSGGTLAVSLGSALAVTGTATLAGTLEVTGADSGYVANTHTDVLTAAGGVTGTFASLVKDSGVVFTSTTIGYGTNDVYLDTTGLDITTAAAAMGIITPASAGAAQRVQGGFDTLNATIASGGTPSSDVLQGASAIQHSATPAVAKATLTSLSGQLHAASTAMLFDSIDANSDAMFEHFDDLLGGRTQPGIWYSGLGWQGDLQRTGYDGATFRTSGGMAGVDTRIGTHLLLGAAAGQSRGFGQLDAAWDHDRTWMNHAAIYGGVTNGPWYVGVELASGWYREDMQRFLQLGARGFPVGSGLTGRYDSAALEGGHVFYFGATRIVPFADVRYQRLDLGGFDEQGALGYGLRADAHTAARVQTGLGVRASHDWRLADGTRIEFGGSAGWQRAARQYGDVFAATFTGFDNWLPLEGIGLSKNVATLRANLSLWPAANVGLKVGYLREQGNGERAGSFMLQGLMRF